MAYSTFEEKEYETPLDRELIGTSPFIWTPGLVFEFYFAVDAALFTHDQEFWKLIGVEPPSGVRLRDHNWDWLRFPSNPIRRMPSFALNLFLQYKRPQRLTRYTRETKKLALNKPYWRFDTSRLGKEHQLRTLVRLANKLGSSAYVGYACAAFDTHEDLYKFTEAGSIVQNSTFVRAAVLAGHRRWVYDKPGTAGFALSEPEEINEEPSFYETISRMLNSKRFPEYTQVTAFSTLIRLASVIVETCKEEVELDTSDEDGGKSSNVKFVPNVHAEFFLQQSRFAERAGLELDLSYENALSAIRDVFFFCTLFNLRWSIIG